MIYGGRWFNALPEWNTENAPPFEWLVLKSALVALGLGSAESGPPFDYIQATDPVDDIPNIVVAGQWWADTANKVIYRRNEANDAWESWTGVFGP